MDTEVLVAWAGPTGLTLAVDLGMRGVRVTLIERKEAPQFLPKMERVNARSMEIFRRMGLAGKIRAAGLPRDVPMDVFIVLSLIEPPLLQLPYPSVAQAKREIAATHDGSLIGMPDRSGLAMTAADEAEDSHRRSQVRRHHDLETAFRVPEMAEQWQGGTEQEGEGREEREAVDRLEGLHPEDAHERSHDERAGDQARDVGIKHDEHAPQWLRRSFVGVNVALKVRGEFDYNVGNLVCHLT